MSGHVQPLPAVLDRLERGHLAFSPWPVVELKAAGVSLPGPDSPVYDTPASVDADGTGDPQVRAAELAVLQRGYAKAPGFVGVSLTSDGGADGLGDEYAHLRYLPALTGDGTLVFVGLVLDTHRPSALADIATPEVAAARLFDHLEHRGRRRGTPLTRGLASFTTVRGSVFFKPSATFHKLLGLTAQDAYSITRRKGMRTGAETIAPGEVTPWIEALLRASVA